MIWRRVRMIKGENKETMLEQQEADPLLRFDKQKEKEKVRPFLCLSLPALLSTPHSGDALNRKTKGRGGVRD